MCRCSPKWCPGTTDWHAVLWSQRQKSRLTRVGFVPGTMSQEGKEIRHGTECEDQCSPTDNYRATTGFIFDSSMNNGLNVQVMKMLGLTVE